MRWPLLIGAFLVLAIPGESAQSPYRYVDEARGDIYFGHINRCDVDEQADLPRVFREGAGTSEPAEVNVPLTPGDSIRTGPGARCELQFDSGSIVRLDQETELAIETVLAPSISSSRKLTNLVLRRGRIYVNYRQHSGSEVFQILTANAGVKLKNDSQVTLDVAPDGKSEVRIERGRAELLYGPAPEAAKSQKIEPGQQLVISADHRIELAAPRAAPASGFAEWNQRLDQRFEVIGQGRGFIPLPIFGYSPAVARFAESYSRAYGQWVWSPVYGHAWRPHDNDYYAAGDWQPYRYGRWRDVGGDLFWVADEGWGWVPYHLGFWLWDAELRWVWIAGRYFAPAWVSWNGYGGYWGWRPWSFWDWYLLSGSSCNYGLGHQWGSCTCSSGRTVVRAGTAVPRPGGEPRPPVPGGDRGERGDGEDRRSPPLEHKRSFERLMAALSRGEESARSSFEAVSRHLVVVREPDLRAASVHERAIVTRELPGDLAPQIREQTEFPGQRGSFLAARRESMPSVEQGPASPAPIPTPERVAPSSTAEPLAFVRALESAPRAAQPGIERAAPRFRDWNPDVRAAQRLGATLTYSSEANQVRCPELTQAVRQGSGGDGSSSSSGSWTGRGSDGGGVRGGASGGARAGASSGHGAGSARERAK